MEILLFFNVSSVEFSDLLKLNNSNCSADNVTAGGGDSPVKGPSQLLIERTRDVMRKKREEGERKSEKKTK